MRNSIHKIFFFLCCFVSSCNLINPDEPIPAILQIESVNVQADQNTEGTDQHQIEDVWVFVNPEGVEAGSELLGVFPLPATIPVLAEGTTELNIRAGVKLNNQNSNRAIYELFSNYAETIELTAGETAILKPTFKYRPPAQIRFDFMNDFETGSDFESVDDALNLELTTNPDFVFEGERSLSVVLSDDFPAFTIISVPSFKVQTNSAMIDEELPIGDRQAYLEMHYKNDATLFVNLYFDAQPIPINILKIGAKQEWSKIYIPLKDILAASNAQRIRLSFEGLKPDSLINARFSWDNIKIIHELQ